MRAEFIDPGAFRHELTLEKATLEPDGAGGHAEQWHEVAVFYARIEPLAARSIFGADQTLETLTHRVTLRHRHDVESGMRFRLRARIFRILTVHDPDETQRYLVCQTGEEGI